MRWVTVYNSIAPETISVVGIEAGSGLQGVSHQMRWKLHISRIYFWTIPLLTAKTNIFALVFMYILKKCNFTFGLVIDESRDGCTPRHCCVSFLCKSSVIERVKSPTHMQGVFLYKNSNLTWLYYSRYLEQVLEMWKEQQRKRPLILRKKMTSATQTVSSSYSVTTLITHFYYVWIVVYQCTSLPLLPSYKQKVTDLICRKGTKKFATMVLIIQNFIHSRRSKRLIKIFNPRLEDLVETILSFSITAYGSQAF